MSRDTQNLPDPDAAARAFAALGSPQRLTVLRLLVRAGPAGLPMGRLADAAGLPAPTLTHHLKALAGAGLVTQTRAGRRIIARVDHDQVRALGAFLVAECCADLGADVRSHTQHAEPA